MRKIIHTIKLSPAVIIPSTLLFLTLTSALVLLSSNSNADTTSATASVTVPDTCYMSSTSTTHTGTASGGTYTENFGGESTVTVTCNDRNGYSVYAVGYSNDIEGTNGLIGTSTGLIIPTGTSTSGDVSNWAMKLTPIAGAFAPTILNGYSNYNVVPTTTTKVATLTSDINVSNSSQFKTSYAVSVAPTQAADTYIGKVKYTVVHPNYANADSTVPTAYSATLTIGSNATSMVVDGVTYSSNTTIMLAQGTHTISGTITSGYDIAWSATGGIAIAGASSASTTITVTGAGTLTLTGEVPKTYIQDLTLASCQVNVGANGNATNVGDEIDVYDKRDEKAYKVKYINGACWMTQNLRFTGTSVPSATSNVTADKTMTYYDLATNGKSGGKCYGASSSGDGWSNACIKDSGDTTKGVWYNYYAATAGTVSGSSNSTVASQDICPKNWHLPTGPNTTSNTDINKLVGNTTYGWQAATTGLTAFSAVAGGRYYNGSLYNTGYGYWWSATANNTALRYYLGYDSSNVQFYGDYSNDRFLGVFVRCVRSS